MLFSLFYAISCPRSFLCWALGVFYLSSGSAICKVQIVSKICVSISYGFITYPITYLQTYVFKLSKSSDSCRTVNFFLVTGCAIWFAARGRGREEEVQYQSSCRVLLTGMGIDEQLGGYSRHRMCFQRDGLQGLKDELRMEILRISERNLGRDNRIVSA